MTISFVQNHDEASVYQLLQESALPTQDLTTEHFKHFFVMKEEGEILGVAGVERLSAQRGLMRSIAVKPEYRGKQIATQLYHAAEEHACSMGMREVYAFTTTIEPWLTRLGFERIERESAPDDIRQTSEFSGLCPASAAILRKTLRVLSEEKPHLYVCA
ncbi:MAG: arsenic resistance N-acetyltransferase ArsN2 [Candidatus Kapaibacteriota bacterium]|jgi:amino-acid N-acetyltransferase